MDVIKKIRFGIVSAFTLNIIIFGDYNTVTAHSATENVTLGIQTSLQLDESEAKGYKSTNEEFTIVRDKKYFATRESIWEFLLKKGYKVETNLGEPNIRKIDVNIDEGYECWYAFIKQNGESIEYSVILINGKVTRIQPVKR